MARDSLSGRRARHSLSGWRARHGLSGLVDGGLGWLETVLVDGELDTV